MLEVADGVWVVTAGAFPSNSYICRADVPGGAILIDAGLDPGPIDEALQRLSMTPRDVFCTHGHFDHVGSAIFFQNKYGAAVHLHAGDEKTVQRNNFLLMVMKLKTRIVLPQFTWVRPDAEYHLGDHRLVYRHTPGHTPGSCVISVDRNLFTGDTLFARGVGLSKLPGEQPGQLRASIVGIWESLDSYAIHPGHGPSASGTAIKSGNRALRAFLDMQPSNDASRISYGV